MASSKRTKVVVTAYFAEQALRLLRCGYRGLTLRQAIYEEDSLRPPEEWDAIADCNATRATIQTEKRKLHRLGCFGWPVLSADVLAWLDLSLTAAQVVSLRAFLGGTTQGLVAVFSLAPRVALH